MRAMARARAGKLRLRGAHPEARRVDVALVDEHVPFLSIECNEAI